MKFRYLMFAYDTDCPNGGMEDCLIKTNDLEEIKNYIGENQFDFEFFEIYDVLEDTNILVDGKPVGYICPRCGKTHLTSPMDICNLCKMEIKLLNAIFNSREED